MRFLPYPFLCATLLLWSNLLFAQSPTTYSLEIHSIISDHGHTLGPVVGQTIAAQWPDWQKVNQGEGDYHIRVDFLEGLDAKQYHRKKVNKRQYIYEVKYIAPTYNTIVTDNSDRTILQKNYGGEVHINPFGADDQYASPDTLADSWKIHREAFYELEEAKYNNVNVMLEDLAAIINEDSSPMVEMIESRLNEMAEPRLTRTEPEPADEEVVMAISETSLDNDVSNNDITSEDIPTSNSDETMNAPTYSTNKIEGKAEKSIRPQVPNEDLEEENAMGYNETVETPTDYMKPESKEETIVETTIEFEEESIERNSADNDTELVAGETPPVPTPQKRKEEVAETTPKPKETDEQREVRLQKIQSEWDQMDKEEEEKNKRPRVRHVRLGLRMFTPIILGGHGEVVLPILDNRISLVGDFSRINFGAILDPFLDSGTSVDDIDVIYRYYAVGANYYFRKKYARGWYLGASYLNNIVKTEVSDGAENSFKGEIGVDSAALRFGVTTGRKAFFFGFEIGAGIPLGKLQGTFYSKTDGDLELDVIEESIGVVPVLNITLGVAL